MSLDIKRTAWSVGILFGLMHLLWVLSIAIFGKPIVDYLLGMHFLGGFNILPFDFVGALIGVIGAFISGAITGAVFAYIWNKLG